MRGFVAFLVSMLVAGVAAADPAKMTIKEERRAYTIDIAYPRMGYPAIDRALENWAKGVAQDFRQAALEQGATGVPQRWASEVDYEVVRHDKQMLVVSFANYSYTGGAHPNTVTETFNFLFPEGRRLEFGEVFSLRGIRRVSDIAIAKLKREFDGEGGSDIDWIKRGAGPNARNFSSFELRAKELVITFDAYQVAAYVMGARDVRIPLSQLRDVMRPDPRAPAASFECGLARSEVERAICASQDLARLDRRLGEAYAFKLSWIDGAGEQEAIRAQQRQWLKMRDANCRGYAIAACLTSMYQKRLKELEAP